jgi:hypothetical protein
MGDVNDLLLIGPKKSCCRAPTPSRAGFEPTRAKPNRFQVCLLNQLGHLDCDVALLAVCRVYYLNVTIMVLVACTLHNF